MAVFCRVTDRVRKDMSCIYPTTDSYYCRGLPSDHAVRSCGGRSPTHAVYMLVESARFSACAAGGGRLWVFRLMPPAGAGCGFVGWGSGSLWFSHVGSHDRVLEAIYMYIESCKSPQVYSCGPASIGDRRSAPRRRYATGASQEFLGNHTQPEK